MYVCTYISYLQFECGHVVHVYVTCNSIAVMLCTHCYLQFECGHVVHVFAEKGPAGPLSKVVIANLDDGNLQKPSFNHLIR